jgi:hypothetical protein
MSYSFTVKADTKAEAKEKIAKEFDNVVSQQPIHAADQSAAVAAGAAFVDVLPDPSDVQQINVHVYGSVGWHDAAEAKNITSANVSVSASLASKA